MNVIARNDIKPGGHFMTVQSLGSGWAAVEMWLNNEHTDLPEDFAEPWQTGIGRYATRAEAYEEACNWCESDEIPMLEDEVHL